MLSRRSRWRASFTFSRSGADPRGELKYVHVRSLVRPVAPAETPVDQQGPTDDCGAWHAQTAPESWPKAWFCTRCAATEMQQNSVQIIRVHPGEKPDQRSRFRQQVHLRTA